MLCLRTAIWVNAGKRGPLPTLDGDLAESLHGANWEKRKKAKWLNEMFGTAASAAGGYLCATPSLIVFKADAVPTIEIWVDGEQVTDQSALEELEDQLVGISSPALPDPVGQKSTRLMAVDAPSGRQRSVADDQSSVSHGRESAELNSERRSYLTAVRDQRWLPLGFLYEDRNALDLYCVEVLLDVSGRRHQQDDVSGNLRLDQLLGEPGAGTDSPPRWAVVGDPGSGKTTLLQHFAHEQAKRALTDNRVTSWLPLFVRLQDLAARAKTFAQTPQNSRDLVRFFAPSAREARIDFLAAEHECGRLALLLDGLDEVASEFRADVRVLLQELASHWGPSPVVFTSRTIGYEWVSDEYAEAEVVHFLPGQQETFLRKWFAPELRVKGRTPTEWVEFLNDKDANPALARDCGNPMWLTLYAWHVQHGDEDLPSPSRIELYLDVIDKRLESPFNPAKRLTDPVTARARLESLAYDMTSKGEKSRRRDALVRWLGVELLDELTTKAQLLEVRAGSTTAKDEITFPHNTFREALAADRLANEWSESKPKRTELLTWVRDLSPGQLGRWAEPCALVTGKLDRAAANEWIRALAEGNRPLALRAASSAQRLDKDTILDLLGLRANAKGEPLSIAERGEAISRVFEALGDREHRDQDAVRSGIDLLGVIAGDTTVVADLHFVFETLASPALRATPRAIEMLLARKVRGEVPRIPRERLNAAKPEIFQDNVLGLWWRKVAAGTYWVGDVTGKGPQEDERPAHPVKLSEFWISALPVTNAQMQAFDKGFKPEDFKKWPASERKRLAEQPAVNIDWYTAMAFSRWLGALLSTGKSVGCLPTEAQWEVACRALEAIGDGVTLEHWLAKYEQAAWRWSAGPTEDALREAAWFGASDWESGTRAVGQKLPNDWGLYDMHGNAWEWCSDWYGDDAYKALGKLKMPKQDPAGPAGGSVRVMRGGGFGDGADGCRSAFRFWSRPGGRWFDRGFRVALPAAPSSG